MNGRYVVLEGYDGSGKSTLAANLAEALDKRDVPVEMVGFPSRMGGIGGLIRSAFVGEAKFAKPAYLPLMVADALDWEPRIKRWVAGGGTFIADRHASFSAFVYQTEDVPEEAVAGMFSLFDWTKPDLAILVDAPVETAMQRQRSRNKQVDVVFEKNSVEYNQRLREKYLGLFARYDGRSAVLDGTLDQAELTQQALALLDI